jgi:E3 ubiquitin ligase SMURF1/2
MILCRTDLSEVAAMSFTEKQLWFLDKMSLLQRPWSEGHIRIEISRAGILEESFHRFMCLRRNELHQWMRISFTGEDGLDAGGLEREWFGLVAAKLLDPTIGLFTCSSGESSSAGNYHINPVSGHVSPLHLEMFQFAGRFFAKAMMEQQSLNAYFSLPLRKQILSLPITFSDLEFVDADVFQNLLWLLDNQNVENLGLFFTIDYHVPGGGTVNFCVCSCYSLFCCRFSDL